MNPKTKKELAQWMKDNCYKFDSYSINGNSIYEGYGIGRSGVSFFWYFTERGSRKPLQYFDSEEEVIAHAYKQIKSDKWARSHCIGFTENRAEAMELVRKLQAMNIEYFEDDIPYHGPDRPTYRVFVFGCDVKKVGDLKELYYHEW